MKTTRVIWDEQWDENFSNYPGLVSILKGPKIEYSLSEPGEKFYDVEEHKLSCDLGELEKPSQLKVEASEYIDKEPLEHEKNERSVFYRPESFTERVQVITPDTVQPIMYSEKVYDDVSSHRGHIQSKKAKKTPKDILFECETGLGFTFSACSDEVMSYTHPKYCIPKTLGMIAIDTSLLHRPKTSIMFSSNIFFMAKGERGIAQLEFILSRSCNNGPETYLGNWVYDITDKEDCSSQTFKFNYCISHSMPGFYHYFVRVLPVYAKNCAIGITQCQLEAYAQSQ